MSLMLRGCPSVDVAKRAPYTCFHQVRYRSAPRKNARKRLAQFVKGGKSNYKSSDIDLLEFENKSKKTSFHDFVHSDPDLRKVIDDANSRIHARFTEPNIFWKNELKLESVTNEALKNELEEKFGKPRKYFEPIDVFSSPLNIGDLVDLSNSLEQSDLCCVVELPGSIDDPRYTFVNMYGELIFASKSKIRLRFPDIYPKEWFKSFVLDEKLFDLKKRGIKQIGKPKFLTEDSIVDSNNKSFFEQALINNGHNLNQLDTFVSPSIPSQLLARQLSKIVADAWDEVPIHNSKLELLHNLLQDSESPVTLNIFQLHRAVQALDLEKAELAILNLRKYEDLINYYSALSKRISEEIDLDNNYRDTTLGKSVLGRFNMFEQFEVSSFYALILSLRKNDNLFIGVGDPDFATQFPLSVTLQPLSRTVEQDLVIDLFKDHPQTFNRLSKYLLQRMELVSKGDVTGLTKLLKPHYYDKIIWLMKLYCSTSTRIDRTTESFLMKVLRSLPQYEDITITSSLVYETLFKLGESSSIQNPIEWSVDLLKPYSGVSEKANLEQDFYNLLSEYDHNVINDSVDHGALIRENFTSEWIYCIDDISAYEVDDGISFEKLPNGLYSVNTYVADPASYLKPSDSISKIAFERASTVYFPNKDTLPIEMLPRAVVKKVELRSGKNETRAMRFSFNYDPETRNIVQKSLKITPALVRNVINITYSQVNEILDDNELVITEVSQKFGVPQEKLKSDLKELHAASKNLNLKRSNGSSFNFKFADQLEGVSKSENDDQLSLKFNSDDLFSPSQVLVSEIMVHTNALVADFMKDNNIPTIYRTLKKIPLSETVQSQIDDLDRSQLKDTQKVANFMTGTSFSLRPLEHDYIGLGPYCTVTSPLRRFPDLMCHWQLHSFLQSQKNSETVLPSTQNLMFSESNVAYALTHICSKTFKIRQASRKSKNFFIFKKLSALPEDTTFKVMISSRPTSGGEAEGILLDFGGVRCSLKSSVFFSNRKLIKDVEEKTRQNLNTFSTLRIGDIVENCQIDDIDLLSGNLKLISPQF